MNDIRLWQWLQQGEDEVPVEELVGELRLMSREPMECRLPYLGMVDGLLEHDNPEVVAAAYAMLSGATGYPAWKMLLGGLEESSPSEVQQAALDSLRESSEHQHDRWNHVLYHPDANIREQAIAELPKGFSEQQLIYLLADKTLRLRVLEYLQNKVLEPTQFTLLLDFVEQRTISIARAMHWLHLISWENRADFYIDALGVGRQVEKWPETPEELEHLLEQLPLQEEDPLDRLNSWLWLVKDSPREEIRAHSLEIWKKIHSRWCRGYLKESSLRRMALSVAYVGFRDWDWEPEPLALCARAMPCILAHTDIPLHIRRAAADQLESSNTRSIVEKPLISLLDSDLCRKDNGLLDLRVVGGLLNFITTHPYEVLLEYVSEDTLLTSLIADPEVSPDFLSIPPQSRKEKRLHRAFLEELVHPRHKPGPSLLAQLTLQLPINRLFFLNHLKSWDAENIQDVLTLLFAGTVPKERRYSGRKIDRIAKILLKVLLPEQLIPVLQSMAESVQRSKATAPSTTVDKTESTTSYVLDSLSALALSCLGYMGRAVEVEELSQVIAALPEEQILALLLLEQHCPIFPYEQERALYRALSLHDSETIRQSVPYTPMAAPKIDNKPLRLRGEVQALSNKEVKAISTCKEHALESHLEVCFRKSVTGLCDALLDREERIPNVSACAALLTCADEPEQIAKTFPLFCEQTSAFLSRLETTVVRLCEQIKDLPLWGTAWLHRWDKQHDAFVRYLVGQPVEIVGSLEWTMSLDSPTLVIQFWKAIRRMLGRWRWREKEQLQDMCQDDFVVFLVDLLLPSSHRSVAALESPPFWALDVISQDIQAEAASMLYTLVRTRLYDEILAQERERLLPFLLQLEPQVQLILRDWLNSQGMVIRKKRSLASLEVVKTNVLEDIRKNYIPRTLERYCRDTRRSIVEEAASQLVTLGKEGTQVLLDLVLEEPALPHLRCLTETIALWEDESCLQELKSSIHRYRSSPEHLFLLAVSMCERGELSWWTFVVEALLQDIEEDWFLADDWSQLQRLPYNQKELAVALVSSPLYGVYSRTLLFLVNTEDEWNELQQQALVSFLKCGNQRPRSYREKAAWKLYHHRCWDGLPILSAKVLYRKKDVELPSGWESLWVGVPDALVLSQIRAALLAGESHISSHHLRRTLQHTDNSSDVQQSAFLDILRTTHDAYMQQEALSTLKHSSKRQRVLRKLAETFAWGMKRGRELTGKIFRIEMIGGDQFGYTRLTESRIFVNPLPLLREEKHGQQVLQGLILHEIGHHVYHADSESQEVWRQAGQERMGQLLNLVSDEQLERSLRAKDPVYGNDLKRLASYAFQHNERDMLFSELLSLLGVQAFAVLHQTPLQPSRRPRHVVLGLGKLFFSLEAAGYSFPRFVRALRMGLGNRHNDPKVEQALKLFPRSFRHSNMAEMLRISYRLREIFGDECDLLSACSQDTVWTGITTESINAEGEGITQQEIQDAIDKLLRGREHESKTGPPVRSINLTGEESFSLLHNIIPLVHNPTEHRSYSQQVKRWSSKMRDYLRRLGLGAVKQRRRMSGYQLDRSGLSNALLRGDPRLLMSRKFVPKADLFVGILVDCSGSMSINDNLEKAKAFATMLADAAAPLSGIDARFFGFTDTEIYDAGNAQRCAVHALEVGGGNNDAAALWHAAQIAQKSARRAKLLIMISDGAPTECSTTALRNLVQRLTDRMNICCAQVAVHPIEEVCFPHYIELTETNLDLAIHRFGTILGRLVRKAIG